MCNSDEFGKYRSANLSQSKTFVIHRLWIAKARKLSRTSWWFLVIYHLIWKLLFGQLFIWINLLFLSLFIFVFYALHTTAPNSIVLVWYVVFAAWTLLQVNESAGDPISARWARITDGRLIIHKDLLAHTANRALSQALAAGKPHQPVGVWFYAFNKIAVLIYAIVASNDWGPGLSFYEYFLTIYGLAVFVLDGLLLGLLSTLGLALPSAKSLAGEIALYVVKALLGFGLIAAAIVTMGRTFVEREVYTGTEANLLRYIKPYVEGSEDAYELLDCGPDPETAMNADLTPRTLDDIESAVQRDRERISRELGIAGNAPTSARG